MYCRKCGSELMEGDNYCSKCGEKVIAVTDVKQAADLPTDTMTWTTSGTNDIPETQEDSRDTVFDFKWDTDLFTQDKKPESDVLDWGDLLGVKKERAKREAAEVAVDDTDLDPNTADVGAEGQEVSDKVEYVQVDKFHTFNKKNEEFQELLNQEYSRMKNPDERMKEVVREIVDSDAPVDPEQAQSAAEFVKKLEEERIVADDEIQKKSKEPVQGVAKSSLMVDEEEGWSSLKTDDQIEEMAKARELFFKTNDIESNVETRRISRDELAGFAKHVNSAADIKDDIPTINETIEPLIGSQTESMDLSKDDNSGNPINKAIADQVEDESASSGIILDAPQEDKDLHIEAVAVESADANVSVAEDNNADAKARSAAPNIVDEDKADSSDDESDGAQEHMNASENGEGPGDEDVSAAAMSHVKLPNKNYDMIFGDNDNNNDENVIPHRRKGRFGTIIIIILAIVMAIEIASLVIRYNFPQSQAAQFIEPMFNAIENFIGGIIGG